MATLFADTSALIKWYIAEAHSDAVDKLFVAQSEITISRLTGVEFCSTLGRRRRNKQISKKLENDTLELFYSHQLAGHLRVLPLNDVHCAEAEHLMHTLPKIPLRALDAMQLAAAKLANMTDFASADKTQISAAKVIGLKIHDFS